MSDINKNLLELYIYAICIWLPFLPRYKSFFQFLVFLLYLPLPSTRCFLFNSALLAAFSACFLASGIDELGNFFSTDPKYRALLEVSLREKLHGDFERTSEHLSETRRKRSRTPLMHTFFNLSGPFWVESLRMPIHRFCISTYEVPECFRRACAHCRLGLDFSVESKTHGLFFQQAERLCAHHDRRD